MQCEGVTLGTWTCRLQSVGSLYMWVHSRWGHFTCGSAVGGGHFTCESADPHVK